METIDGENGLKKPRIIYNTKLSETLLSEIYLTSFTQEDVNKLDLISQIWSHNPESVALMKHHTLTFINEQPNYGDILLIRSSDGKIIGITGWYPVRGLDDYIGLRRHGVFPEYRGTGVGEYVLKLLCDRLIDMNPNSKYLCEAVPEYNLKAQDFFKRLGFLEIINEPERSLYLTEAEMFDGVIPLALDIHSYLKSKERVSI